MVADGRGGVGGGGRMQMFSVDDDEDEATLLPRETFVHIPSPSSSPSGQYPQ